MFSNWLFSASSRAISADVFGFAMVAPNSPTWRGLNSGCAPDGLNLPAWCRGYHAGLSFLRPGFNSRSGRLTLLQGEFRMSFYRGLWVVRAESTTSMEVQEVHPNSSRARC